MIFRWVPSDVMETLRSSWAGKGYGLDIAGRPLLYLVCADDTWLVVKPPEEFNAMIQELMAEARNVGLQFRLSKCKRAQVKRADQRDERPKLEHTELAAMARVPETECLRVLGAPVHTQADSTREFDEIVARAWSAFHAKAPLWRSRGHLHAKLRLLHLGIFLRFAWASGTRH